VCVCVCVDEGRGKRVYGKDEDLSVNTALTGWA
jgi:hypothetical protein